MTNPAAIFDCMRKDEYCRALKDAFDWVPDMPNSLIYTEAKKRFCKLDSSKAHDLMVSIVRKRGKNDTSMKLVKNAPVSLKHACLCFSKPLQTLERLHEKLNEPLIQ